MKTHKPPSAAARTAAVIGLQVRVPRPLHDRYKAACALRGVSMSEDLVSHMRDAAGRWTAGGPVAGTGRASSRARRQAR